MWAQPITPRSLRSEVAATAAPPLSKGMWAALIVVDGIKERTTRWGTQRVGGQTTRKGGRTTRGRGRAMRREHGSQPYPPLSFPEGCGRLVLARWKSFGGRNTRGDPRGGRPSQCVAKTNHNEACGSFSPLLLLSPHPTNSLPHTDVARRRRRPWKQQQQRRPCQQQQQRR